MDPVTAAMNLAEDEDGAGYYLILTLTTGRTLRGSVHRPRDGVVRIDVPIDDGTDNRRVVMVAVDHVVSAEIEP